MAYVRAQDRKLAGKIYEGIYPEVRMCLADIHRHDHEMLTILTREGRVMYSHQSGNVVKAFALTRDPKNRSST